MTLQEYIDTLSWEEQHKVAIKFCKIALPIWESYLGQSSLDYYDTVVGLFHSIEKDLLKQSIERVEYLLAHTHTAPDTILTHLHRQFIDPVVALQDSDLELPDAVAKTFYSVYNLLESFVGKKMSIFGKRTSYVSINQSIDAITSANILTWDRVREILYDEPL